MSKLFLVSTPIGNLGDITFRAVQTLQEADIIACEDTRHSLKLLNHLNIKKPLVSCHKFNEKHSAGKLIDEIENGKTVAFISDAGMPAISDPGAELVKICIEKNIEYTIIPGANAALCALVLSGFDSSAFSFFGFLPLQNKEREQLSKKFVNLETSLIFYCPPHRLASDIQYLFKILGARKAALVKEISKIHEKCTFITLGNEISKDEKGEFVVVIEGAKPQENPLCKLSISEHFKHYAQLDKMDAVKAVARDRGVAKSEIYKLINDKNSVNDE